MQRIQIISSSIVGQTLTVGKISIHLLQESRTIPHISAYTHIFGEFDFNRTPLDPTGTRVVIHNSPNDRISWVPHGKDGWYIGPSMEHYRFHKSCIPKTRAERISDTVEFFPKKFKMPHISSMGATYHSAQDLIYALHNPEPAIPLVKLVDGHKGSFRALLEIFRKANPPAVPPRVSVREVGQKKLQEVNQEGTQMKSATQSKPFTNTEPLKVTIVYAYPDELQPVNPSKKR